MKTHIRILSALAFATLLATGCVNEDPAYRNEGPDPANPGDGQGYLALDGMSVRVIRDTETEMKPEDTSGETQRPASRAESAQPATDDFLVTITASDGTQVLRKSYAELAAETAGNPYPLPVGAYTLRVCSEAEEDTPDVAWEHPVYGTSREFTILKEQSTSIGEVVCKLENIKVTVLCSADLAARLSDDTKATVSLGAASIDFPKGETRAAYFRPQDEVGTLDFRLTGTFVGTTQAADFSKTIPGVKAGQWRKISLVISHADKGDAKLDIEVENFIQDEEITVDGTGGAAEPELPEIDPTQPGIDWAGHDLSQPFRLLASMFDAQGACTEPVALALTARNGISAAEVSFSSDNAEFLAAIRSALGLAEPTFDLCAAEPGTPLHTALQGYGFPLGDAILGQSACTLDLAPLMPVIYDFDGNHDLAFAVTDGASGKTTRATLRLRVDRAGEGTSVVWKDHDLEQRYPVTDDLTVDIDITVPRGIRSFLVTINSVNLEPALTVIGLPEGVNSFDLTAIEEGTDLAKYLSSPVADGGFGFPINGQVRDRTELTFSITAFVPMLKGFSGDHDFRLDITDNAGNVTTRTIRMETIL